ncbi:MAG: alpha/beta fold hydrolase [Tabrizicola sp.]|nr:alpha/beta fold hydrolase [Tabrizicola sp.]
MKRLVLLGLFLAGCAARGDFTLAPSATGAGQPEEIFVATSRTEGPDGFGFERSETAYFLRYDVSIPPERELGELNWPPRTRKPDAVRDFLLLDEVRFASSEDFRQSLQGELRKRGQTDVVVYVHGFNNTMAEGVYRVAQMHHDLAVPGVAVHYAWPSRGSPLGYVHDRESVLFARSGFEALLNEVAAAGADDIVIVAHSMGAFVTMETLRQMVLRDGTRALDHIAGVVLIAPDLDVDVFRAQAAEIGDLPQPFVIFGSSRDRVLGVSARIAGSKGRLGNLPSVDVVADLPVTYLDTAAYNVGVGHLNLGENPALLKLFGGLIGIDQAFREDARERVGLLPGLILTVRSATEVILTPSSVAPDACRDRQAAPKDCHGPITPE